RRTTRRRRTRRPRRRRCPRRRSRRRARGVTPRTTCSCRRRRSRPTRRSFSRSISDGCGGRAAPARRGGGPGGRRPRRRRLCVSEAEEQMKRAFPTEFLYQAFALVIAVLVVRVPYVTVVRPKASAILAEQALRMQQDANYSPGQSVWVVIRDYEQEACLVRMLWARAIIAYRAAM